MSFTTTLTTKNQLTLPKPVRDKLGVKKGVRFDIYPTSDGFIGRLKRRSRILNFAGDLKNLDNGKTIKEIREEAQRLAAEEINAKIISK
ncbi:MAG: AbrB/MazE/SpoVT family DNA-binding domain-containing protein [bacterium]|nr:AbrB/MazE/SpoVT family DNA-binding domain-containing protein [bacterium]